MIIRDFNKQLEFSTFLNDEQILLKTDKKFMVFSNDAEFINTIRFYDDNKQKIKDQGHEAFRNEHNITSSIF